VVDDNLTDIGDCKLGPDPRKHFQRNVVPRMTAPDQTCDKFEADMPAARAAGGGMD
jgi:hypothetical protein